MVRRSARVAGLRACLLVTASLALGCSDAMSPDEGSTVDTTPPTVLTISPSDGASDVVPSTSVVVTFSELMDGDSLTDMAYALSSPSGPVDSRASLIGSRLTITPEGDLAESTEYTVTVGTELTDVAGNALLEPVETRFTTGLAPLPPVSAQDDVRFVGRFDASDPGAVRLSWSGSGFEVRFRGTGARANLSGGRFLTVVVDGEVEPVPLEVSDTETTYDLATDLVDGEHTVEVYRRTEASNGPTVVSEVEVFGGPLEVPAPTRHLEIVGDSWSTGDGVDPRGGPCDVRAQNHYITWGAIAARALDAELSNVAWGGRGVVGLPIQPAYPLVIGTEPGSTGTISPADAVLVSLGANDLVDGALPAGFVDAYTGLLEQVRAQHPDALIACIWPRLDSPTELDLTRTAIETAVAERVTAGDGNVVTADLELVSLVDLACDDYHPGADSHVLMADNAIAFLQAELGW